MRKIVFAPHLDDEVIGCYSIWDEIDIVVYFTSDYRERIVLDVLEMKTLDIKFPKYISSKDFDFNSIEKTDTVYLPSKYDFHPLHKKIRNSIGLFLDCKKMFYSVEMNVPWLEEEEDSKGKLKLLKLLYPREDLFLHNAKYYLFKSIKPYDDIEFLEILVSVFVVRIQIIPDEPIDTTLIKNIVMGGIKNNQRNMYIYHQIQMQYPTRVIELEITDIKKVKIK